MAGRPKSRPEDLVKNRRKNTDLKRGPLSDKDKENVRKFMDIKSDEEIAVLLNRPVKQIGEYRYKLISSGNIEVLTKRSETEELKNELHSQMDWALFQKEFTAAELIHFENDYVNYRQQFKDLTQTERKQLYQLIILDIKMHRHNTDLMKDGQDIDRMERLLKDLCERRETAPTNEQQRILVTIAELEVQLQACRTSKVARSKEYKDLLDKHSSILKDLKSTREQRIKNLDDQGKFIGLLKQLEMEDRKKAIAELTGLMELAEKKEYDRLSTPHKYMDGLTDIPLLTPEVVDRNAEA